MSDTRRVLCISDLHLSAERPDIHRAFTRFLADQAATATDLFILGDFFNLWIGDDDPDPFAAGIKSQLGELAASGTRVHLMHGNRDFLLGEAFCSDTGAVLVREPYLLSCFDDHYLLMHGDSLCTRDTDYMAFRDMVRDPAWQQAFLAKPIIERQEFAAQARAKSKAMSSNKPEDIMDVTPVEVSAVLSQTHQHTLVHGHTHRPAIHDIDIDGEPGTRIVLGDWDKKGWYLEITPGGYSLRDFAIS